MTTWSGNIEVILQNKSSTVGVVRVNEKGKSQIRKLAGFWNKKLLHDVVEALDLFDYRDVEIGVIEDGAGASLLMMKSPHSKNDDIYISVAGKTEAIE